MKIILYIHGKGGNAGEAAAFQKNCPGYIVRGVDYHGENPWEVAKELQEAYQRVRADADSVLLLANSIGAYYGMLALQGCPLEKALLISPVVDMEQLILDMMGWAGVTEKELETKGEIPTSFGETLSWEYLSFVRVHPIHWDIPTEILYGGRDGMIRRESVEKFAKSHSARITVMEEGEHWFHTEEQLAFLDQWMERVIQSPGGFSPET